MKNIHLTTFALLNEAKETITAHNTGDRTH